MNEAATASAPSTLATSPLETVHAVQTSEHDADTSTGQNNAHLNAPSSESTAWSQTLQSILSFLEQADNGVLLKILGALAILTYLILGRLGLLLIGLVAGFVIHDYCGGLVADTDVAAGNVDGRNGGIAVFSSRKRRELGIEVAARLLEWKPTQSVQDTNQAENVSENVSQDTNSLDLSRIPPATADALTHLIDAIIDNYVLYWYRPILPTENSFAASCRKIVVGFVNSLSVHMTRKRSADTFLQFVTNASSMIIVFLSELSLALRETPTDSSSTEEHVRQYLIKYPDSSLANVLSIEQQQKKLRMVADDVLLNFLEPSAFNCEALRTFFREILAGVVLESIVKSCSQPDFINGWIVYLLKEGEPQIMNVIDAGLESASKGDIAGLSGLAGDRSQDSARRTSRSVENRMADSGLKNVASHEPHNDDQSSLMSSGERHTDSSKSSIREIPDASSVKSISSINSPESPQQFVAGSQQRSPNEVSKFASREEVEAAGQILYGASVVVDDGSLPSDKTTMKAKPNTEYMLQIEPASTRYPGWMIFRKYQDFEHLHEGLATLSRLHRVPFLSIHPVLPTYRDQTKAGLAKSLERYLRDALEHKDFAKSERLRKFLDKDNGLIETTTAQGRPGFNIRASSTFENMGKNVLGVLSNAPKGVAGSGKAVLDGVTGVFTGSNRSRNSVDNTSKGFVNLPMSVSNDAPIAARQRTLDPAFGNATQEASSRLSIEQNINSAVDRDSEVSTTAILTKDSPLKQVGEKTPAQDLVDRPMSPALSVSSSLPKTSIDNGRSKLDTLDGVLPVELGDDAADRQVTGDTKSIPAKPLSQPINEDETRMGVELIFAVINELYALSSAWNIRKTLLNAAKTYILRPRNPHLEAIRVLVQDSMIDANTTDEAIAANIRKIRENSLPTEVEMKAWPPPLSREESERLKNEARRLLIERGMPQVLTSVMGAAASGEALGKVFDCLQVDEVGRGFMFALILQALRAVIL